MKVKRIKRRIVCCIKFLAQFFEVAGRLLSKLRSRSKLARPITSHLELQMVAGSLSVIVAVLLPLISLAQGTTSKSLVDNSWQGVLQKDVLGKLKFKHDDNSSVNDEQYLNKLLAEKQLNPVPADGSKVQYPINLTIKDGELKVGPKSTAFMKLGDLDQQLGDLVQQYNKKYSDAIADLVVRKETKGYETVDTLPPFKKIVNETNFNKVRNEALSLNSKLEQAYAEKAIKFFRKLSMDGELTSQEFASIEQIRQCSGDLKTERFALEGKTAYRGDKVANYRASHYGEIEKTSCSVGRIQKRDNGQLVGSAVYVGNGYILTAAHNVLGKDTSPLEITFNEISAGAGANAYRFSMAIDFQTSPPAGAPCMDLALCRIQGATPDVLKNIPCAHPLKTLIDDPVIPLKEKTLVYVAGYPNSGDFSGSRVIHDDSFVLIPHWVSKDDIKKLYASLTFAEIEKQCMVSEKELHDKVRKYSESFYRIYGYKLNNEDSAAMPDRYIAKCNGMEIIGLETDTAHGDSGGGVFQKDTCALVAIFSSGQNDTKTYPNGATIEEFEASIPVETFWKYIINKIEDNN